MPRPYRLGERAAQIQATRERILEAATDLYIEQGISATTMRDIGQRADVAPGTLRKHFARRDDLEQAMIDHLASPVTRPDLSIFDGARSMGERLERVIRAGGVFLDQADRVYRMWLKEPKLPASWAEMGAEFGATWDRLMRAALGSLADDEEAMTILRAVIQPSFFDHLRTGGRTTDEVSALVTALVTPWFAARLKGRRKG